MNINDENIANCPPCTEDSQNTKSISLAELQKIVDRWITTTGGGYFSRLTNMVVLTEEVGELARIIARRDGDQRPKSDDAVSDEKLADELADILWVTIALANQSGVNLEDAFAKNIDKKNTRDKERFI